MVKLKEYSIYKKNGQLDLTAWLNKVTEQFQPQPIDTILKAIEFARTATEGLSTFYGQTCFEQSIEMADIILDLKLDQNAIAASILANIPHYTNVKLADLTEKMNEDIGKLISGASKLNVLHSLTNLEKDKNQVQKDRLRKAFLAMASDIRVILIKLAERTCMMRGIKNINPIERKHLAQETMDVYAPLANRLGIGQIKWELEDLSFHYIDSETYKKIAAYLAEKRIEREERIQNIKTLLKENLTKAHVEAQISGRAKHIYSIYLKMKRKHLALKDIYDYSAVRILVPSIQDCYTALSIVHTLWEHIPEEFDDYITKPKPNGYRSIHTAVVDPAGKTFEIQIRTNSMHEEAEHGVAAHWIYKEDKSPVSGYEAKITLLRQLLDWHKDLAKGDQPNQQMEQILEDRVYVFTPAGEVIDLPSGATPLDFAYHIHSEIGHRCRGAKINGHIVPLTYALQTSDKVEIITIQNGTPSRDWLNKEVGYLKTSRAKAKVMQWFKQQDQSHLENEKQVNERETSRASQHKPDQAVQPIITKKAVEKTRGFRVGETRDLLTRIARCCKPIPGDSIVGYITQGRGVTIHKNKCSNLIYYKLNKDNRLIQVNWDEKNLGGYYADLQINAYNSEHILKEITSLLANAKVDLIMLNSSVNKIKNICSIVMTVQINDVTQLNQLITQIRNLSHVINVKRTSE